MMLHIDTQKIYSALIAGGFTEQQADTVIEAMRHIDLSHLATKDDVKEAKTELKAEIADVKAELKAEIASVKAELKAEIADVRTELKAEIADVKAELKAEIADVKADIRVLKWMMGFVLAGIASLVAQNFF